jgi:hypothetical protein
MQPPHQRMSFNPKGIGSLLAEDRMRVPLNQREYSWEDEQVEDLIHDFAEAMDSDVGLHFLGSILLTPGEKGHSEITDGQQRLATSTMILASLRDYLLRMGLEEDARAIDLQFLFVWDRDDRENVPRLQLNADDHSFFHEAILKRPKEREKRKRDKTVKESHKLMENASRIIHTYFEKRLDPEKDELKVKIINKWIRFVEKSAIVVVIAAPADLDAYVMFETLNDRGLETSKADLLKNHLFSKARDRMEEAQTKWSNMNGKLASLGHRNLTVTFIRHLLITKYGATKERDVLKTVKGEIAKASQAVNFLTLMEDGADDYVAMLNPSHNKWIAYGDETRDHLWTIHQDLQVKQIWPLLFAVARHFTVREGKMAFKYLVNLSVRFLIVGGRGGLLDRHYAERAQDVGTGKMKTAKALMESLASIAPTDESFELEFSTARVSESNLARYYLRAMENCAVQLPNPEVMPIEDRNKLNLEHILPENPGEGWSHFSEDEIRAYSRRIGNLVLLNAMTNSKIGNKPFNEKRPSYAASSLQLTKMAAEPTEWTKEEIEVRQKKLAKVAVRTWPLNIK